MSANFFLNKLNLFKGLKNVLRDVTQTLDAVCDDPTYRALYKSVSALSHSPDLLELSKIHTNSQKFLKSLKQCEAKCAPRVDSYFDEVEAMSKVSQLFVNLFRHLNEIIEIIQSLEGLNCVDICKVECYFNYFSKIAFPCEKCVLFKRCECEPVVDECGDLLIPVNEYPVSFIVWLIYFIGRIVSGCGPTSAEHELPELSPSNLNQTLEVGLIFFMEMNSLADAYEQFVKVGLALKWFPSQLK